MMPLKLSGARENPGEIINALGLGRVFRFEANGGKTLIFNKDSQHSPSLLFL